MDAARFGAFVAEMRKEKHLTQAELAAKIGVTDKAISRWERGLGFPDINSLEPLADALDVSVLELMKSEKIAENNIQCGDATNVLMDTIKVTEHQNQLERKKEKSIILISICVVVVLSMFALLIDNFGWTIETVLFTSIGVVFPFVSFAIFIVLIVIGLVRYVRRKPCKHIIITALAFAGVLIAFSLTFFIIGLFAFPGQQ